MHLADGTIPLTHAAAYGAASGTMVALGIKQYYNNAKDRLHFNVLSGIFAAFVFTVTIFEIPMPFGSSTHPTGTPLAAIFAGPLITPLISAVVLLLELVFREGGVTTLGANVLSLGVVGGIAGWGIFKIAGRLGSGLFVAGFLAGLLGDLSVYLITAFQLSLGNPGSHSFWYYIIAFLPGQVPLAILEGIFTGIVLQYIYKRRPGILKEYKVVK